MNTNTQKFRNELHALTPDPSHASNASHASHASNASHASHATHAKGLVLVFDLDETIAKFVEIKRNLSNIDDIIINPAILDILDKATKEKETGLVDAILLLTNNIDGTYITIVEDKISDYIPFFEFDYMMKRDDPHRYDTRKIPNKVKHIEDVKRMLSTRGISIDNLPERVYFFDDIHDHEIGKYIPEDHYIKITPKYDSNIEDKTDYSAIYRALGLPYEQLGGRSRKTRRKATRRGRRKVTRRKATRKTKIGRINKTRTN